MQYVKKETLSFVSKAFGFVVFVSLNAGATSQHIYMSDLQQSRWLSQGDKLECRLTHAIPVFGMADFRQRAGEALKFRLMAMDGRRRPGKGELLAMAPAWIHDRPVDDRKFTLQLKTGTSPVMLGAEEAQWMLDVLKSGNSASFLLAADGKLQPKQVVNLSPVRFQKAFAKFNKCLGGLLPYTFESISRLELHFATRSARLTPEMQQELDRIVAYLKADKGKYRIAIAGHTDSVASRRFNLALSEKRARVVENYLKQQGIQGVTFITKWFGESRPMANNRTASGRAKNRRVEIRLSHQSG